MIIRPDQARIYSMGRGEARILVDAERSGGTWWLGEFREDPGYTTGLHFHPQTDERFFVLDGVPSVYVEGQWHDLQPGGVAEVPHGTPHAQANAGKQPVRFLGSGNPCGFERFFPELQRTRRAPRALRPSVRRRGCQNREPARHTNSRSAAPENPARLSRLQSLTRAARQPTASITTFSTPFQASDRGSTTSKCPAPAISTSRASSFVLCFAPT